MNELAAALRRKKTFLALETHLLKQAKRLYDTGFKPGNLTSSQMAAITTSLQAATNFEEARKEITKFLDKQMKKLEAKDRRESWWKTAGGGEKDPLGATLQKWVKEEEYLPTGPVSDDLDRLAALRRFWSNVHGMYRYHKACGENMPLNEEELS